MDFVGAIKVGLQKYADFRGVATRPEYWWFFLFTYLAGLIGGAIDLALRQDSFGPAQTIVNIALWLPTLAITVRRNRDAGFSAWWLTLWILPFIAIFVSVYLNIDAMRAWYTQFADPNFSITTDQQVIHNLTQLAIFFGPALLTLVAVSIFFFVVSLLPSKSKPVPQAVATTDY
jgi:uncharacterized membrane protein YhaH (DUF805 family)